MGTIWMVELGVKGYAIRYSILVVGAEDGLDAEEKGKKLVEERFATCNRVPEFTDDTSAWVVQDLDGAVLVGLK